MMQQQVVASAGGLAPPRRRRDCCHTVYCVVYIVISLVSLLMQVGCTGTKVPWFSVDFGYYDRYKISPREVVEHSYFDDGDLPFNLMRACLASGILACLFLLGAFVLIFLAGFRSINQRATRLRRLGIFSALALFFQILAAATFDRAIKEAEISHNGSFDSGFFMQCIAMSTNIVAWIMATVWRKYPHVGYNIIMTAPQNNINQSIIVQQQHHNVQHVHQHQQAPQQPQYPQIQQQQQQPLHQSQREQWQPQPSQPQSWQQLPGQQQQQQGKQWQPHEQDRSQEQPPSYPEASSSLQLHSKLNDGSDASSVIADASLSSSASATAAAATATATATPTSTATTASTNVTLEPSVCLGCKQSLREGTRFCPSCGYQQYQ